MIKATIIGLAAMGAVGTGGQAVAPQAFEISAGNVTMEISADGITSRANENPSLGLTWVTKGDRRITIRF